MDTTIDMFVKEDKAVETDEYIIKRLLNVFHADYISNKFTTFGRFELDSENNKKLTHETKIPLQIENKEDYIYKFINIEIKLPSGITGWKVLDYIDENLDECTSEFQYYGNLLRDRIKSEKAVFNFFNSLVWLLKKGWYQRLYKCRGKAETPHDALLYIYRNEFLKQDELSLKWLTDFDESLFNFEGYYGKTKYQKIINAPYKNYKLCNPFRDGNLFKTLRWRIHYIFDKSDGKKQEVVDKGKLMSLDGLLTQEEMSYFMKLLVFNEKYSFEFYENRYIPMNVWDKVVEYEN